MTQINASEAKECNYYLQIAVQLCRWYAADQQKKFEHCSTFAANRDNFGTYLFTIATIQR